MHKVLYAVFALLLAAGAFSLTSTPAAAAGAGSAGISVQDIQDVVKAPLVQKVQYGYCRRWFRVCRNRWGAGPRFRRCMRRHGCGAGGWGPGGWGPGMGHHHCQRWRRICAGRWGWGNWRFRRCVRAHGCF